MRWSLLLLLFLISLRVLDRFHPDTLRITLIDVGQGDAILVQFPRGKVLLVDSGNPGRELLLALAARAILHLDIALLTHPDRDHAGGLPELLNRIRVDELWVHEHFLHGERPLLLSVRHAAERQRTELKRIDEATEGKFDGVNWRLLPPEPSSRKDNDRSLVLELEYQGCRALLTGDLEAKGERWLSERMARPIDLLKVAHHGSRSATQSNFLGKARPQFSAISVGRRNPYHHPTGETLERLQDSDVLRTDFHGFLEFTFSNGELACRSAVGECGRRRCWHQAPHGAFSRPVADP